MKRTLLALVLATVGCVSVPDDIETVSDFQLERYLGTWYEIARFDHRFERGMDNVTATYSLRDDGGISVLNRGFDREAEQWRSASGKAYPVGDIGRGRLKVSFFGPFYGGYNIIALDERNYEYVMVCGNDRSSLWILSRSPSLPAETMNELVARAESEGFATDELIVVRHDGAD